MPAPTAAATRPDLVRAFDLVGAVAGLVASAPLLAAAAVAIRREDGGPVLFRQERVGRGGRPFTLLKLRTMEVGAERRGAGLEIEAADSRVSRVGRWLRDRGIDELPQLVNVLRGDMSLVGPRPTVASQVARYTPEQARRLQVRPGLAGWAQVNGRNAIPWSRRIELDVWYVEHRSVRLDLQILARALLLAVRGPGPGHTGATTDLDT